MLKHDTKYEKCSCVAQTSNMQTLFGCRSRRLFLPIPPFQMILSFPTWALKTPTAFSGWPEFIFNSRLKWTNRGCKNFLKGESTLEIKAPGKLSLRSSVQWERENWWLQIQWKSMRGWVWALWTLEIWKSSERHAGLKKTNCVFSGINWIRSVKTGSNTIFYNN